MSANGSTPIDCGLGRSPPRRARRCVDGAPPRVARDHRHQRHARHDSGRDRRRSRGRRTPRLPPSSRDDTIRRDLVGPGQHRNDRQADDARMVSAVIHQLGQAQRLEGGLRDLKHDPHADQVGADDLEHVAPPQLRRAVSAGRGRWRDRRRPGPAVAIAHRDRGRQRIEVCDQHEVRCGRCSRCNAGPAASHQAAHAASESSRAAGVSLPASAGQTRSPQFAAAHGLALSLGQRGQQRELITASGCRPAEPVIRASRGSTSHSPSRNPSCRSAASMPPLTVSASRP